MSGGYASGTAGVARNMEEVFGTNADRVEDNIRSGQATVDLGVLVLGDSGAAWEELQLRGKQPITAEEIIDSLTE